MATGHSFKNPEMIIAVSALIVSLITAFASIYSAYIDRACSDMGSRSAATALLGTWRRIAVAVYVIIGKPGFKLAAKACLKPVI